MSKNNSSKLLMAFLAGAAVGAAVGYFLNSDKKDELVEDLKEGAASLKKVFDNSFGTVKDIVDAFTSDDFESETDVPTKS
jgi:gas vesicle protein